MVALVYRIGIGAAFSGCSRVEGSEGVANTRTTRCILHRRNMANIEVRRITNDVASRFSPEAGMVELSSAIFGDASITTMNITYRRTNRTIRRTRGCLPGEVHSFVLPITELNSDLD